MKLHVPSQQMMNSFYMMANRVVIVATMYTFHAIAMQKNYIEAGWYLISSKFIRHATEGIASL